MNGNGIAGFNGLSDGEVLRKLRDCSLDEAAVPALERAANGGQGIPTVFVIDPDTVDAIIFGDGVAPVSAKATST